MTIVIALLSILVMTQLITLIFCGRFIAHWKVILVSLAAWPVFLLHVLIDPRNRYRNWHRLAAIGTWVGFGFVPVELLVGYDHPYDPYVISGVFGAGTVLWFIAGLFCPNADYLSREFRRAVVFAKEEELSEQFFLGNVTEEEFKAKRDRLLWEWAGGRS